MPILPPITRSWFEIGGTQPQPDGITRFWTWAQVRTAVTIDGTPAAFAFGFGSHSKTYSPAETQGRLFRGIPLGINGTFVSVAQAAPSTDYDWFFFWGGVYESPPESGIFVNGIGAGLDESEIGTVLDGAAVVCQNISFTTTSAARDAGTANGQLIGSLPNGTTPGAVTSITLAF
jgi:hypothetical protein